MKDPRRSRAAAAGLLLVIAGASLAGCASHSAPSLPSSWISTGTGWLDYISWTATDDGKLSGQLERINASTAQTGAETTNDSTGFTGLLNAGKVTLNLQGGDTLTGTVGAKKLELQGAIISGSSTASFSPASTALLASQTKIVADQVDAKREAAKDAQQAQQQAQTQEDAQTGQANLAPDLAAMNVDASKVSGDIQNANGVIAKEKSFVAGEKCSTSDSDAQMDNLQTQIDGYVADIEDHAGDLQSATQTASADLTAVVNGDPGADLQDQSDHVKAAAALYDEATGDETSLDSDFIDAQSPYFALPVC